MTQLLNQFGLVLGFCAAILLLFATKVGVISKTGTIVFEGLDPMGDVDEKIRIVESSHRRFRIMRPLGLLMLSLSFILQFIATLI